MELPSCPSSALGESPQPLHWTGGGHSYLITVLLLPPPTTAHTAAQ